MVKPDLPTTPEKLGMDEKALSDEVVDERIYEAYPKGLYLGAAVSLFYRDMRSDSAWRFTYNNFKKYKNPLWGPATDFEVGYQLSQNWGVGAQTGWVANQKVTAGNTTSSFSQGDYKKLETCWAAILLRTRLKMDYRYYFIAEFGPAYVSQSLKSLRTSTVTKTQNNKLLPTAIIGIEYRATENLNVGLQYQLIWGQQNWRDTWAGLETRYPALQMLGIKFSYQFNT
jgi:opacity protein-like surface antigen